MRARLWAILPLLVFRPPRPGYRHHIIAAALAFIVVAICSVALGAFDRAATIEKQFHFHTQISVEQAINSALCGRYGYLFVKSNVRNNIWLSPTKPIRDVIVSEHGTLSAYCSRVNDRYLNNENSPFLIFSALMFRKNASVSDLALGMIVFRFALLLVCLYLLAAWGLGVVPIGLIAFGTTYVLSLVSGDQLMSVYAGLIVMLLFTSSLAGLAARAVCGKSAFAAAVIGGSLGFILGFVFNFRTPYGVVMAAQLIITMAASVLFGFQWKAGVRCAIGVLAVIVGFICFQYGFIRPLEAESVTYQWVIGDIKQTNKSYHTVWHSVVLGLADPRNELADQEGIEWADPAGFKIAKKLKPDMTMAEYGGDYYESIMQGFYFNLWKHHPKEMLTIYANKLFQLSGTTPFVGFLASNGYEWFAFLIGGALCGLLYRKVNFYLGVFTLSLAVGVIVISIEQVIIMPAFSLQFQGGLLVGFGALSVMFLSYPVIYFIWLRQCEIPITERRWRPLLTWLGLAFLPWLSSLIPLPPELYRFPIAPLNEKNWTLHAPARLVGESILIKGAVPFGGAYAAESAAYVLPRGRPNRRGGKSLDAVDLCWGC